MLPVLVRNADREILTAALTGEVTTEVIGGAESPVIGVAAAAPGNYC
jgi:hypothetical protein